MKFGISWLIVVVIVGALAHAKNRSVAGWMALSILFPLIVGIILLCLPTIEEVAVTPIKPILPSQAAGSSDTDTLLDQETKKCPFCAELIKLEAKKCRFCAEKFHPDEVERQIETRRVEFADRLAKQREGKTQCPQCDNWDLRWATIEDGGVGHWCDNCKKSLKAMGVA
jgi:hypothetical protein